MSGRQTEGSAGYAALADPSSADTEQHSKVPFPGPDTFDAAARPQSELADYCGDIPALSRQIVERALRGAASPRGAIKAMCLSCVHYARLEVTYCTAWRCPLWRYRPYQDRGGECSK